MPVFRETPRSDKLFETTLISGEENNLINFFSYERSFSTNLIRLK